MSKGQDNLLEHSFLHIPGIGRNKEQNLWQRGVLTWEHFLNKRRIIFSPDRYKFIRKCLRKSLQNRNNIRFFVDRLPSGEIWRAYDCFKAGAVYLDKAFSGYFNPDCAVENVARVEKTQAKREVGAILNRRHIHKYVEDQNCEKSVAARFFRPQ